MEQLDVAFTEAFEQLPLTKDYAGAIQLLRQGASAKYLETNELGPYNVAMLVKELSMIKEKEQLMQAAELVRLSIAAGTDLDHQKAYVGNGGMPAIEWICFYLARGLAEVTLTQFRCYYNLFPVVAAHTQRSGFHTYLLCLNKRRETWDMQVQLILQMKALGWQLREEPETRFFSRLVREDEQVLFMLDYGVLNANGLQNLLNGFTSSNKARKLFRMHAHKGLLQLIIDKLPEVVYKLIRRNEQDMLVPFLKHYKKEVAAQPELLKEAVKGRSVVENTILQLRQAGLDV